MPLHRWHVGMMLSSGGDLIAWVCEGKDHLVDTGAVCREWYRDSPAIDSRISVCFSIPLGLRHIPEPVRVAEADR